ncbi:TetR/AcrR family transcriptional regulator [Streptomyces sp. H10-C2]|uniref:TetR/AcrR family transcriptional regulator n=1 Tax=unclassified Streptomyces TaxID=2593676 RepID=UPI0024B91EEB|nr:MULTISPECIES: TetR/AcrR family transcriptional regulator [unclassified Streptomyces]MDJ0342113.1 TetR/AcrR family transcriptional regulator [Streptomyces sp. PH10-H1]MDJ0368455.1 TetR/AcrR family transcriptional regulator [Streptomyces sp. H10-C2]
MADDSRAITPEASVWLHERPAVKRRSEQPAGLDRDKIVATAVRLLDTDGLAKFSMRKLAAELGVTAMSVYWYVDTKDDLLERALDAVNAEIVLPAEEPDADWRDEVRQLATGYRTMLVAHPWAGHLINEFLNIGPHSMEFSNAALRAVTRAGLPPEQMTGALGCVFQYVYGYGTTEGRWGERFRASGLDEDEFYADWVGAVEDRPEFAQSTELLKHRTVTVAEQRDRDFTFGLDVVIAGIDAMRVRLAQG